MCEHREHRGRFSCAHKEASCGIMLRGEHYAKTSEKTKCKRNLSHNVKGYQSTKHF